MLASCVSPRFHLNAADGTEFCALAAAYAAFRLHGGVAATAHLDGPQWTGISHTPQATHRVLSMAASFFDSIASSLNPTRICNRAYSGRPLEARICNWILELLAHTFGCLCALPAAGAVPAGALESFSDGADNLLIGIELDFHVRQLFLDCGFIIPQDKVFFCDEVH